VVDGEVMEYPFYYGYFLLCRLFISNGSYGFLFSMAFALLLRFCWAHFWWCGVFSIVALMGEGQRIEKKDKERVVWSSNEGFYFFQQRRRLIV
jgi:hypothetical protein